MKVKTIQRVIRGALIIGALVMFLPLIIFTYSDYLSAFMYAGGAISVCGMIFSLMCLLYPGCRTCQNVIVFQGVSAKNCPHCGGELT